MAMRWGGRLEIMCKKHIIFFVKMCKSYNKNQTKNGMLDNKKTKLIKK